MQHSMIFFFHHYELPLILYHERLQRIISDLQHNPVGGFFIRFNFALHCFFFGGGRGKGVIITLYCSRRPYLDNVMNTVEQMHEWMTMKNAKDIEAKILLYFGKFSVVVLFPHYL